MKCNYGHNLFRLWCLVSAALSGSSLVSQGNELLKLLDETVKGETFVPLELAKPKPRAVNTAVAKESKKILHVAPTPWLEQRPDPVLKVEEPFAPAITEASFGGLVEFGSHYGSVDDTDIDSARLRRARFSAMLGLFYESTLEASGLLDGDADWAGFDRLTLRHYLTDGHAVTVGKFRPPFGHFYGTDPSLRDIPDLPALTRLLSPDNTLGVYYDGYSGSWDWGVGHWRQLKSWIQVSSRG